MECFCSLINQPLSSELNLDKSISSVSQVCYGIAFKTILVPKVIDLPIQCFRIYTKIPYAHCLEKKSHRIEVGNQFLRSYT